MTDDHEHDENRMVPWRRLGVLAVGLIALAFMVAIERPHWFSIRPATGTALAMAHAPSETERRVP